ncbi:hypothetical protein QR680_012797 [Steinernema hermaphroditum]|uniref:Uncharacterized protein n=1 Tax=Steinernema hermaphroditum TaxID=289476 RepID=A0AA39I398_9BILA|nr:hypothetical protein QR680_012797 [Steinernema hermaphroditum]
MGWYFALTGLGEWKKRFCGTLVVGVCIMFAPPGRVNEKRCVQIIVEARNTRLQIGHHVLTKIVVLIEEERCDPSS